MLLFIAHFIAVGKWLLQFGAHKAQYYKKGDDAQCHDQYLFDRGLILIVVVHIHLQVHTQSSRLKAGYTNGL